MGIHIYLHIQPQRIDEAAWAGVYDDALTLLLAHPDGLIGPREHRKSGRGYYSRDLEVDADKPGRRHLVVCGDMKSKQTGESFELYRSLYPSGARHYREHATDATDATDAEDILLTYHEHGWRTHQVFSSKTQGCPYHLAVLAMAMLVEHRFPTAAVVSGDINAAQAVRAAKWVHGVLGQELRLPVCVDPQALRDRLGRYYSGEQMVALFLSIFEGDKQLAYMTLLERPGKDALMAYWRLELRHYKQSKQVGVGWLYVDWLNGTVDLETLLRVSCLDKDGPQFPPEEALASVAQTWVTCDPGELEVLSSLRPPDGEPETVAGQLVGAFLDMGLSGRKIRRYISQQDAADIVARCFPMDATRLVQILRQRTAEASASLAGLCESLRQKLSLPANQAQENDTSGLVLARSLAELSESQRRTVRYCVFGMLEVARKLEADSRFREVRTGSTEQLRKRVLSTLERISLTLTAEAWEWIEREKDPEMLRFLLLVGALDLSEMVVHDVRRALLESESLCREVLGLMQDPVAYAQTQREVQTERDRFNNTAAARRP